MFKTVYDRKTGFTLMEVEDEKPKTQKSKPKPKEKTEKNED